MQTYCQGENLKHPIQGPWSMVMSDTVQSVHVVFLSTLVEATYALVHDE